MRHAPIKSTVAAVLLAVGFSLPSAAQELPDPFAAPDDPVEPQVGAERVEEDGIAALLDRLAEAEPPEDRLIVGRIMAEWSKSGSATIDLLLQRGRDAIEAGEYRRAADHLSAAIDHAPDFAEAYNLRATAYYLDGLVGPALEDIARALSLNPDHFNAMEGLAVILEEVDRPEDALEVYRRVHAMHPADQRVGSAVERLEIMLGGRAL